MKYEFHYTKRRYLKTEMNSIATLSVLGRVWEQNELNSVLCNNDDVSILTNKIKNFFGFFSIVYQNKDDLFASVDHIRSHPLFYGQKNGKFYLSDEADWVKEQVGDTNFDQVARDEFQLTGYVTGRDTLYPNVKQLQAGECLTVIAGKLSIYRYYTFEHTEPKQYDEDRLLNKLDKVANNAIARLIEYASDRQIVIPLSGGYDSRLIATLLKKSKYPNIICFTYGIKGNKDATYSKIVAEALELPWYFVEYTKQHWKEAYNTEEGKQYKRLAFNYVSLPHFQDWLAVRNFKENGIIKDDAVFVPGHCCVTGFIPNSLKTEKWNEVTLCSKLTNQHYNLAPLRVIKKESLEIIKNKLLTYISETGTLSKSFCASKLMTFNWQERQSKFIGNSIRAYEFWGFDWWMPLWDQQFTKYWSCFPLKYRLERCFYKKYVTDKFKNQSNNKISLGNDVVSKATFSLAKKLLIKSKIVNIRDKICSLLPQKNANAIEGRFDAKIYNRMLRQGYKSNGISAYFTLKDIEKSCSIKNE